MGKGDDPNCSSNVAMIDPLDGVPDSGTVMLAGRPSEQLGGWPVFSDRDAILHRLHGDDWMDYPTAEHLLRALPAGDPAAWHAALDGYRCPRTGFMVRLPWPLPFDAQRDSNPGYGYGGMLISGVIYDGDEPVGDIGLAVGIDPEGNAELRIGAMELRHYLHGKTATPRTTDRLSRGFGRGFVSHLEGAARRLGVRRVSLHAVGGGCYVWASLGFDWDPRTNKDLSDGVAAVAEAAGDTALCMHGKLRRLADTQQLPPETPDRFAEWFNALPTAPTPEHLAGWGREYPMRSPDTGRMSWAGAVAICDSDWDGVKTL